MLILTLHVLSSQLLDKLQVAVVELIYTIALQLR